MLDMKTIMVGCSASNSLIAVLMAILWRQNRKRYDGISLWLIAAIMQALGTSLYIPRDILPDLVTIIMANTLFIAGHLVWYWGLERFVGKQRPQIYNVIILTIFVCLMSYFTYVQANISVRVMLWSAAALLITAQCSELMLRRVDSWLKPITRYVGLVFLLYALIVFARIVLFSLIEIFPDTSLFRLPAEDRLILLVLQMISLGLMVALMMMVTDRQRLDMEKRDAERRPAEKALEENERLLRIATEVTQIGIWQWDVKNDVWYASPTYYTMLGHEYLGGPSDRAVWLKRVHSDDRKTVTEKIKNVLDGLSATYQYEARMKHADGSYRWHRVIGSTVERDEDGRPTCLMGVRIDITDSKQAQNALQESEEKYRSLVDQSLLGIIIVQDGCIRYANRMIAEKGAYSVDELMALPPTEVIQLIHPEDREIVWNRMLSRLSGKQEPARNECRLLAKNGTAYWVDVHTNIIEYSGRPAVQMCLIDITERKLAEEALRHSEAQLSNAMNIAKLGYWEYDVAENMFSFNDHFYAIFHASAEQVGGYKLSPERYAELFLHPDDRPMVVAEVKKSLETTDPHYSRQLEHRIFYADGGIGYISVRHFVVKDNQGRTIKTYGANQDITERKQREEALRESESKYRTLVENIPQKIFTKDKDSVFMSCNKNLARDLGITPDQIVGKTDHDFFPRELADKYRADDKRILETGQTEELEEKYRLAGQEAWIQTIKTPIRQEDGRIVGLLGVFWDITERKRAEEEREKLQAQLNRAQKMEAVGRLAGGVAHDYNNILGVIIGYSELAMEKVAAGDPLREDLNEIYNAANRSRDITRQLLAFARKETIAPEVLDLNATVENMLKILRKLVGEDIDLAWHPGKVPEPVLMDPSQLDQILANLCINARDAIADIGRITIETGTATIDADYCPEHAEFIPGEFVLLVVSDDGCGMDRETVDHIFEPFFTTKGVGKGTGLGLSTVYGIVKQNNGFINVYSEPGRGTTFRIYLPRHSGAISEKPRTTDEHIVNGGGEAVLVVEDEIAILKLTERILSRCNYKVLLAKSPSEAREVAQAHSGQIALLITDVVMPEMNGRELANQLKVLCPGIKCLFMSGYTADVIAHRGVLDEGVAFIQKPFSIRGLAAKVREALEKKIE